MLQLIRVDKGKTEKDDNLITPNEFTGKADCYKYLKEEFLPGLQRKGFLAASIDSISDEINKTIAWVYTGEKYTWGQVSLDSTIRSNHQRKRNNIYFLPGSQLDPNQLTSLKEKLLNDYENNGYPFATILLDSSYFLGTQLFGRLKVVKGPLYHIDSISLEGKLRIQKSFLENYLDLPRGSIYSRERLGNISKRIRQLGFAKESRPWDLTLLGTGSKLNLYLEPKRSSQINLLAGFMPSNPQLGGKLLLTGEADMQLKNAFGGGENLLLNWQQIQVQSPRLVLGFQTPYLFKTDVGIDFQFNLLKKDSTFITINTKLGILYSVSSKYTGKVFFQQFSSSLLDLDTNLIKITKRLPANLDVGTSNIGIDFKYLGTDDQFNPRAGFEWNTSITGGVRKIKKNNAITKLTQDAMGKPFNYASLYDTVKASSSQVRLYLKADYYQQVGRQATIKFGAKAGFVQSEKLFTNELFQIGGIKTLRGFDEEGIFVSQYFIATLEYRYLIGPSSYLFSFVDAAHAERKTYQSNYAGNFLGVGLGMSFETKSGIFNLAYAAGKQPNAPLNLRESKIHFGFISLF